MITSIASLYIALSQMGYKNKKRGWTMKCISTNSFSILINGSTSTNILKASRGFKARGSNFAFLINMVTERFGSPPLKAKQLCFINDFELGSDAFKI